MTWKIINGNSSEILKTYPDNSFDCVVTDPPYGISFLGKAWDHNTGDREVYEQCLRVLKPGGHLLAFSAARTYHHLAMTVETVGFEIRDQIMWIYGSGFPKSQDVGRQIDKAAGKQITKQAFTDGTNRSVNNCAGGSQICILCNSTTGPIHKKCDRPDCIKPWIKEPSQNEWSGWGTQLKPAHEPIVMARKPVIGSIRENVLEHGTGAINIDATRVAGLTEKELNWTPQRQQAGDTTEIGTFGASGLVGKEISMFNDKGRFPANVIMDDEAGKILDEQAPKVGNLFSGKRTKSSVTGSGHSLVKEKHEGEDNGVFDGLGGASRFFYCPKVNSKERHIGTAENNHPTVKPIELMKYLIKLVTPPNGHILDPFNGSGSTGCAAVELGFDYTGIELDPNYVEIATKRISHWESECKPKTTYNELFEEH